MPRLILKCRYIKNQKAHLENLVRYIATRDGAAPVRNTKGYLPASGKQKKLIAELLKDLPATKDLFEYSDYKKHPTIENASEFITTALEQNLDLIGKKKNYVDYIAHRPGGGKAWFARALYRCRSPGCSAKSQGRGFQSFRKCLDRRHINQARRCGTVGIRSGRSMAVASSSKKKPNGRVHEDSTGSVQMVCGIS